MSSPRSPFLPSDSLAFALHQAAQVVAAVLAGQSLAGGLLNRVTPTARPAVQDIVYGTLRHYGRGRGLLAQLLTRPLTVPEVEALLLVALYRLDSRPEQPHTVVDQAVLAVDKLAGERFKGLVNAILRNRLRQQASLDEQLARNDEARWQHPAWWLARLQTAYPDAWQGIVAAGNNPPPMALRINRRRTAPGAYGEALAARDLAARQDGEAAFLLDQAVPVDRLPGFDEGWVSVQDPGAQRAAMLLDPAPGARVLDACAAPGGKTAHLLERNDLELLALDLKAARCRRIEENLHRLGLAATVKVADCTKPSAWWDGRPFDAILADVPCTASGVVRRHPDAKWLRRDEDVTSFAATQARILDVLWQLLAPGGKLLYATCSVFPEENSRQIEAFLQRRPEVIRHHEEQLLPNVDHDGFYYCLLAKPR